MKTIVGMECHASLNQGIKTKLFCRCALPQANAQPNTHTCPTCLALPGAKPKVNKRAIEQALKLALALNCTIQSPMVFSRKVYFYPDLPSNYQRTQYEIPLGKDGYVQLDSGKKIRIERIHLEEDPGALIHQGNTSLIDYNRSGTPLCEIVTHPDLESAKEAREFMNKIQTLLQYTGVFELTTGTLKADANVNIPGHVHTEIKNITGFKDIELAILYEAKRQSQLDHPLTTRETRRWDADKGITVFMRSKEGEADYGYIVDTDLTPITITENMQRIAQESLPELPQQKYERYTKELKIKQNDATVIINNFTLMQVYEDAIQVIDPQFAAEWIRREVTRVLNYSKKELKDTFVAQHVKTIMQLIANKKITRQTGQKLMEIIVNEDLDVESYIEEHNLHAVDNSEELQQIARDTLAENEQAVQEVLKGNQKSFNFLVGQIMRKTKGQADPQQVNEILRNLLSK